MNISGECHLGHMYVSCTLCSGGTLHNLIFSDTFLPLYWKGWMLWEYGWENKNRGWGISLVQGNPPSVGSHENNTPTLKPTLPSCPSMLNPSNIFGSRCVPCEWATATSSFAWRQLGKCPCITLGILQQQKLLYLLFLCSHLLQIWKIKNKIMIV